MQHKDNNTRINECQVCFHHCAWGTLLQRLTSIHIRQDPVDELTEDLSRFLHRLVVLSRAGAADTDTSDAL